jgi:hypothetical protein
MTGSMPKDGSLRRAPMPQTRREGSYPSFFGAISIKAIYFIALIALYFALAKTYTEFLQPLYAYEHFKRHYVPTREVESLIVLSVAAAIMPTNFRRPSDLFMSFAVVLTLVPTAMMYTHAGLGLETAVVTYVGLAVIFLAREVPIPFRVWPAQGIVTLTPLTCLSLLGVVTAAYHLGFASFSLDLVDVYGRRAIADSKLTGISRYIVSFAEQGNLLATIMSFWCRRWVSLVVNVTAGFLFFGLIGNKGLFYGIFFFVTLIIVMRSRFSLILIVSCFSAVAVSYYLFFMDLEHLTFGHLFEQRSLFLPVFLNDIYLHIFHNMKLFWAGSKLSLGLVDDPLPVVPQNFVAYLWVHMPTTSANTGFVGSGYMNAGLTGILIYAVVIGLCCGVIDKFARHRGTQSVAAVVCLPGFWAAVVSGDLPTVLFSGGWGLAILFSAVFEPRSARLIRRVTLNPKKIELTQPQRSNDPR